MNQFDGIPRRDTDGGPREAELKTDPVDQEPGGVAEFDAFIFVSEAARPGAETRDSERALEHRWILRHDQKSLGGKDGLRRERERDAALDLPAAEGDRVWGGVEEFDELGGLGFVRGIEMDFVDDGLSVKNRCHPAQKADPNCRRKVPPELHASWEATLREGYRSGKAPGRLCGNRELEAGRSLRAG